MIREALGLSEHEVAKQSRRLQKKGYAKINSEQLRAWEGDKAEPELKHLETLAEIYGVPVGYFFHSEREIVPILMRTARDYYKDEKRNE
jgi:transcriptional regulator with XRE-family HTH domain